MDGSLTTTYVAAIQHDLLDLPESTRRVDVVRKPTRWFHGVLRSQNELSAVDTHIAS